MTRTIKEQLFGEKWQLIIPGSTSSTIKYAVQKWVESAQKAVEDHGFFAVALSGGSTPLLIYQTLCSKEYKNDIPWDKIYFFFSDERAVPPNHPDSNYAMAMERGGFVHMNIKKENIFRMVAEENIESNAAAYQKRLEEVLGKRPLDLIMLGIGEDGHTASLFPHTEAIHTPQNTLVTANFVPAHNSWRMTFTAHLINRAKNISIYALGSAKGAIIERMLTTKYNPEELPIQSVGTPTNKAHLIIDDEASWKVLARMQ